MYVIFPADEVILLSYGYAQNPRFQRRPTLDNLQETIVPSQGTRPPPNLGVQSNHNSLSRQNESHLRSSINSRTSSKRDPSPNVSFADDFMNKSSSSVVEENTFRAEISLSSGSNTLEKKKGKFKDRISKISLGKLSRPSSNEQAESASSRLREDLEYRVTNPTFTHDNLRQKNFDAFFASGEPVYSLERKDRQLSYSSLLTPITPLSAATTIDTPSSFGPSPTTPNLISSDKPRKNSIAALFSPKFTKQSSVGNSKRPNSAELYRSAEGSVKEPTKPSRRIFAWRGFSPSRSKMAASSSGGALKDLVHPSLNEALKTQNSVTFKLVKTVSDFTETLAQLYEKHAEELQALVSNYRKKNGELRKERPPCQSGLFHAWETFLQEVEADSQTTGELSNLLSKQVSRPLLERSFHRKVQSRKVFTHRESFETIIAKTEEKLSKCRIDYKQCFSAHRQNPTQNSLTAYIDSHNAYVQQLHATNAMLEAYNCETVPQLLQELEEIYTDLCNIVAEAIVQGAEAISTRAIEQSKRYDGLVQHSKNISAQQDLTNFARNTPISASLLRVPKKIFAPPQPPGEGEESLEYNDNLPPLFKNELIIEPHASLQLRPSLDSLRREAQDLDGQIRQLQDSIDALARNQQRGLDSSLYNKANELQEDISMKKFDLRAKQIHLSAVKAQKELFLSKLEPGSPNPGERKMSTASSTSMKTKWLKAFRSLKPAGSENPSVAETSSNSNSNNNNARPNTRHMYHAVSTVLNLRKNGNASASSQIRIESEHNLQEYTYKKITPCDVCSQVLRGHTRQGVRCRVCKVNAHADCASQLPKCQVKAKLLRRQKSTSEIENRVDQEEEKPNDLDTIYKVLKKAGEISAAAERNQASGSSQPIMDIPTVNVPDYPDRTPRRTQVKVSMGPALQQRQGLTAPSTADVSCSDRQAGTSSATASTSQVYDPGVKRRLFAGFRPLSGFGLLRMRSQQNRSISLPENETASRHGRPLRLTSDDEEPPDDSYYSRAPHSPRRQKLSNRMKSLSLDSPDAAEMHGSRRRYPNQSTSVYHHGSGGLEQCTPPSNNSRLHSPSSPSDKKKLLYATRGLKTGSVDLPDEIEKSLSSASTSPCPSPKPQRLLPTNLHVVLYNFKARHQDELDMKAGYKVTVIDKSDPDWWKGKCLGRIGYFPSKYCAKLAAGEKPLQVTHNLQVSDGERGELTLLRDQIVIQIGEEINGMMMVRSADNRQGVCPSKYLQDV